MNILKEKCFTKEWLDDQRAQIQRVDPGQLEKSIHAVELVGLLAQKEIPFSFKGGTCMLLLLDKIRRLSIDVDIACIRSPSFSFSWSFPPFARVVFQSSECRRWRPLPERAGLAEGGEGFGQPTIHNRVHSVSAVI